MPKGKVVTMEQGTREALTLHPYYIKAIDYMKSISWGKLGTPAQAVAKAEMARMLQVYERFGAMQQPLRFTNGKVVWEVRFPPGSKWLSGPEAPSAYLAMMDNYLRNNRFPGYGALGKATDDGLRSLDRVLDDALAKDKQHSQNIILDAQQRAAFEAKR